MILGRCCTRLMLASMHAGITVIDVFTTSKQDTHMHLTLGNLPNPVVMVLQKQLGTALLVMMRQSQQT